jgi:hypothetical protein
VVRTWVRVFLGVHKKQHGVLGALHQERGMKWRAVLSNTGARRYPVAQTARMQVGSHAWGGGTCSSMCSTPVHAGLPWSSHKKSGGPKAPRVTHHQGGTPPR